MTKLHIFPRHGHIFYRTGYFPTVAVMIGLYASSNGKGSRAKVYYDRFDYRMKE
ncbi:MAG: hypothetical protein LBF89_05870 [Bacteroidales bacterium]|nr:hypothetical protein [Bacteroidales bacterium]